MIQEMIIISPPHSLKKVVMIIIIENVQTVKSSKQNVVEIVVLCKAGYGIENSEYVES